MPSANGALGAALGETLPAFGVRFENTRQVVGSLNLRPDILIAADGRSPVAVKAEFMPSPPNATRSILIPAPPKMSQ